MGAMVMATAAEPAQPSPLAEIGAELAFGMTSTAGLDTGWVGRLQYHLMPVAAPRDEAGPFVDIGYGYEFWRVGPGTWGMDLPVLAQVGVRASVVRMEAGIGLDVFVLDRVHGDTGFGLYAPMAAFTAGVDIYGFTLLADARVSHRWQWGASDFDQWTFSIGVGGTTSPGPHAARP